jgi:hypothetical protein
MKAAAILLAASGPILLRLGWHRERPPVIAGWAMLGVRQRCC